jgi:hypothetical protein
MQLRVARLCLDCEELFVGDTCPVCASQRYAFLSTWLPVEERRRWRKPPPKAAEAAEGHLDKLKRFLDRWLNDDEPGPAAQALRTRASDAVPKLDFEEPEKEPQKQPAAARQLVRDDST